MLIANRYRSLNSSDKGGMGEILFCEDLHLQRQVVLKYLQPGVEARRLMDEQKSLVKLRSKHVVQLYDIVSIQSNGTQHPAIVLEFINGKNLNTEEFTANIKFLNIIWQISCGLADIHLGGITHRDIKPGNIKIDTEGVVKILDFGLSRNKDNARTRSIIGTPIFMAPELWGDETIAFDSSIDVYAFGVTCFVLLAKKPLSSLKHQPPQRPSWEVFSAPFSGIPEEISQVLYRCISANSADRPSMQEIRDMLARQLLRNRHRATVILNDTVHTLDSKNRQIVLNAKVGNLTVEYDGLDFRIKSVSGDVYINNTPATKDTVVPGCCVLTFGNNNSNRKFVTFDISNPEVMP